MLKDVKMEPQNSDYARIQKFSQRGSNFDNVFLCVFF